MAEIFLQYMLGLSLVTAAGIVAYHDDGLRDAFIRMFMHPIRWVFGGRARRGRRRS